MTEIKYTRIIQAVTETPWAIQPAKLAIIRDLVAFRVNGGKLTDEEVAERMAAGRQRASQSAQIYVAHGQSRTGGAGVAVLPMIGTIIPRANLFTEMSGGVSVQGFTKAFRRALKDPDVGSIVIDVDSPGGLSDLVDELSHEIYQARGQKPVTAVANTLAASAAYWIATAADELVVTPSGLVGSVGVYAIHEDFSAMLEREGVKVSLIRAGDFKAEGNPWEPLTEEARANIQQRVDEVYDMFVGAVARNRGVTRRQVLDTYGQGRVIGAKEAVKLGMADRVATLDDTVARVLRASKPRRGAAADMDYRRRRLRLAENQGGR